MRTVNVADLKNHLSRYLRAVREGEEILIRDRKTPVAKIVPLPLAEDFDAEEMALAAAGRLRLPTKKLPESFWFPPAKGSKRVLKRAIDAVRRDREERDASILGRWRNRTALYPTSGQRAFPPAAPRVSRPDRVVGNAGGGPERDRADVGVGIHEWLWPF